MTNEPSNRDRRSSPTGDPSFSGGAAPGPRPGVDLERLAALLDGRLPPHERTNVLAELDGDAETLTIYAEAIAIAREEEGKSPGDRALPGQRLSWRRAVRFWPVAVAAGLGAVIVRLVTQSPTGSPLGDVRHVVAALEPAQPPTTWQDTPWTEVRGERDLLTPRSRAIRIGARLTQLELAATLGAGSAPEVAGQVATLLEGIAGGVAAASAFRSMATGGPIADQALDDAIAGAEQMAGVREVRIGAWLQAIRIAAARNDRQFFATLDSRALIAELQALPDVRSSTMQLGEQLLRGTATPDWDVISSTTTAVLVLLAR